VLSESASELAHESAHSDISSLVSASVVLAFDCRNAEHRGYCCWGWADSLHCCFLPAPDTRRIAGRWGSLSHMRAFITIIILTASNSLFAQIEQPDLDSLYVRTIRSQIDLAISSGHKYFEVTPNTERIKDHVGIAVFKFLPDSELIDKAIKEKRPITVYRVIHKIISTDTVDVNIGEVTVTAKRTILLGKKANFAVGCGGTNGYVPDKRFVYDSTAGTWNEIEFVKPPNYREQLRKN
jgi:hypothetical protein